MELADILDAQRAGSRPCMTTAESQHLLIAHCDIRSDIQEALSACRGKLLYLPTKGGGLSSEIAHRSTESRFNPAKVPVTRSMLLRIPMLPRRTSRRLNLEPKPWNQHAAALYMLGGRSHIGSKGPEAAFLAAS